MGYICTRDFQWYHTIFPTIIKTMKKLIFISIFVFNIYAQYSIEPAGVTINKNPEYQISRYEDLSDSLKMYLNVYTFDYLINMPSSNQLNYCLIETNEHKFHNFNAITDLADTTVSKQGNFGGILSSMELSKNYYFKSDKLIIRKSKILFNEYNQKIEFIYFMKKYSLKLTFLFKDQLNKSDYEQIIRISHNIVIPQELQITDYKIIKYLLILIALLYSIGVLKFNSKLVR